MTIVYLLMLVFVLARGLPDAVDSAAQAEAVASGGILAVDSDFLFMDIRPSTLPFEGAGMGVFAKVDIPANEILCEYRGAVIPIEVQYKSNYLYSSKKITGEGIHIVPDMDKPICAMINDCALIVGNTYTEEELNNYLNDTALSMPTYPGYQHNAMPMFTNMGKVFIYSTAPIPAGAEIFYSYGNAYWASRIKYPEMF